MNRLILAFACMLFVVSCKKETNSFQPGESGSIILEFDNIFGENDLDLNSGAYSNSFNEVYTISALDYYVTNIRLQSADGSVFVVPKDSSYFLIKEAVESSHKVELRNIPAADYTSVTFVIGVDSLKSKTPHVERTGVLDPEGEGAGMYRDAESGYIFLKMEGSSPASTAEEKMFNYHVGGVGGHSSSLNNIREVKIAAPADVSAKVRHHTAHTPVVHIFADASKILDGQTKVSITEHSSIDFYGMSAVLADNYSSMFSIDHIHND